MHYDRVRGKKFGWSGASLYVEQIIFLGARAEQSAKTLDASQTCSSLTCKDAQKPLGVQGGEDGFPWLQSSLRGLDSHPRTLLPQSKACGSMDIVVKMY